MQSFGDREPELTFPNRWSYTLIGRTEEDLRVAGSEVAGNRDHSMELSNRSSKGKYVSVTLEVLVQSHEEQRAIFAQLKDRPEVAFLI